LIGKSIITDPAFDEEAAKEEAIKETKRVLPIHEDLSKAYVPELRGRTKAQALEMLGKVGLELGEVEEIIGSVWAPDRIMFVTPEVNTTVAKGTKVNIGITGNWFTGPAVPADKTAW